MAELVDEQFSHVEGFYFHFLLLHEDGSRCPSTGVMSIDMIKRLRLISGASLGISEIMEPCLIEPRVFF